MLLQKLAEAGAIRSAARGEHLMPDRPAKSRRGRFQVALLFHRNSQVVVGASQAALQGQVAGKLTRQLLLNCHRFAKCILSLLRAASTAVKEPQMVESYRQI